MWHISFSGLLDNVGQIQWVSALWNSFHCTDKGLTVILTSVSGDVLCSGHTVSFIERSQRGVQISFPSHCRGGRHFLFCTLIYLSWPAFCLLSLCRRLNECLWRKNVSTVVLDYKIIKWFARCIRLPVYFALLNTLSWLKSRNCLFSLTFTNYACLYKCYDIQ